MCTIKLKERDNHLAVKVLNERKRDNQNTKKTEGLMRTDMRETHTQTHNRHKRRKTREQKKHVHVFECFFFLLVAFIRR